MMLLCNAFHIGFSCGCIISSHVVHSKCGSTMLRLYATDCQGIKMELVITKSLSLSFFLYLCECCLIMIMSECCSSHLASGTLPIWLLLLHGLLNQSGKSETCWDNSQNALHFFLYLVRLHGGNSRHPVDTQGSSNPAGGPNVACSEPLSSSWQASGPLDHVQPCVASPALGTPKNMSSWFFLKSKSYLKALVGFLRRPLLPLRTCSRTWMCWFCGIPPIHVSKLLVAGEWESIGVCPLFL